MVAGIEISAHLLQIPTRLKRIVGGFKPNKDDCHL